jgi:hypothetical protein
MQSPPATPGNRNLSLDASDCSDVSGTMSNHRHNVAHLHLRQKSHNVASLVQNKRIELGVDVSDDAVSLDRAPRETRAVKHLWYGMPYVIQRPTSPARHARNSDFANGICFVSPVAAHCDLA